MREERTPLERRLDVLGRRLVWLALGVAGLVGGLEAIRALKQAGFSPKRPIELLIFTSEEPTRFGVGCLGSRLLSGNRDASVDEKLKDKGGQTLCDTRKAAGFSGDLQHVQLQRGYYSSFVELHIEQAPLLEQEQLDIGVVTAIAAPASLRILIEGQGGHAGGVLMPDRHDALCAASEIILAIESSVKSTGSRDTVGTTGVCERFVREGPIFAASREFAAAGVPPVATTFSRFVRGSLLK